MTGLLMSLWIAGTPEAWGVDQLCRFGFDSYFEKTDDVLFEPNGDDYFLENDTYRARGAFVQLIRVADGAVLDSTYLDDEGEAVFDIPNYPVKFRLKASFDVENAGRYVAVYQDATDTDVAYVDGPAITSLLVPGSTTVAYGTAFLASTAGNEWMNVGLAAAWTVRRRASAYPTYADNGAVYRFAMDDPGGGGGKWFSSIEMVKIDPGITNDAWRSKTLIAHETGHALQYWANDGAQGLSDTSLNAASCASGSGSVHRLVSKEYESGAIHEGMAQWVAAVAFNNTTQADCKHVPFGSVLWYDTAGSSHPGSYSCEGDADGDPGVEEAFGVYGLDYYHEVHGFSPNDVACNDTSPNTGVAVELDWERFLWDLTTKEGVTFGEIVNAYVAAEPQSWYSGSPKDDFEDGLEAEVGTAPWAAQAARNGVDW